MKRNRIIFNNYKVPSQLISKVSFSRDQRLISLESPKAFIDFLMKYSFKIIQLSIHKKSKVVNKVRLFHNFGRYLLFLNKNHGSLFVVKYLKAAQLSLQRKLAGSPFSSLREIEPDLNLPRLSKSGLPAFIGSRDRASILAGNHQVIQMWLSLFGLYRVIQAPVKPKLSTITDEFTGNIDFLNGTLDKFASLSKQFIDTKRLSLRSRLLFLQTSSPSSKVSCLGITKDAVSFTYHGMDTLIEKWLSLTQNFDLLKLFSILKLKNKAPFINEASWLNKETGEVQSSSQLEKRFDNGSESLFSSRAGFKYESSEEARKWTCTPGKKTPFKPGWNIGQLAFKEEAAGKLRIFAMVDNWTQSIFKPLHDFLFSVLKSFPNDGTFDQSASFNRAVEKSKVSGHCFGYDLSSATDRLPIAIQVAILNPVLGSELAQLWKSILVDREYAIPRNPYGIEDPVKYSVGQPMGALSSWAMLAVTHHMIVQYSWQLLGNKTFCTDYEVLGDDIVIFHPLLAQKYCEFMASIGVPLNEKKSVISIQKVPVVEYAKRTSFNSHDVSPISWKMFFNQDTFAGRLSVVSFWWMRKPSFLFSSFETILKKNLWDDRPKKNPNSYLSLLTSLCSRGCIPFEWILAKISEKKVFVLPFGRAVVINFPFDWAKQVLSSYWLKKDNLKDLFPLISFNYSITERYYKAAVRKQIKSLLSKHSEQSFEEFIKNYSKLTFSVYFRGYLKMLVFQHQLTFRSMRFINLDHFELDKLLKMLRQLQDASIIFNLLDSPVKKSVISNDLSILTFIEKANRKSNRADPSICPMTFFTWGQMMFTGFQQRH